MRVIYRGCIQDTINSLVDLEEENNGYDADLHRQDSGPTVSATG